MKTHSKKKKPTTRFRGWRDDSVVKMLAVQSYRPVFGSRHSRNKPNMLQKPIISAPRDPACFSGFHVHSHEDRHTTCVHTFTDRYTHIKVHKSLEGEYQVYSICYIALLRSQNPTDTTKKGKKFQTIMVGKDRVVHGRGKV